MDLLGAYGSSGTSDSDSDGGNLKNGRKNNISIISKTTTINLAPSVPKRIGHLEGAVSNAVTKLKHNPTVESLYAPLQGPEDPSSLQPLNSLKKNHYTGHIAAEQMDSFAFDQQYTTFNTLGFAVNPDNPSQLIGDAKNINQFSSYDNIRNLGNKKQTKEIRKRDRSFNDPSDVNSYKGPWQPFDHDMRKVKKADPEEVKAFKKRVKENKKKRGQHVSSSEEEEDNDDSKNSDKSDKSSEDDDAKEDKDNKAKKKLKKTEEHTILHVAQEKDYQGRTYISPPPGLNTTPAPKSYIPSRVTHTYPGHNKGVTNFQLFPKTAHLLLSCGNDATIKLWSTTGKKQLLRSYMGHTLGVKKLAFNNDGTRFLSCSFDRKIKLWDTETGQCINKFSNRHVINDIKVNPDEDKQNEFLSAGEDKKIIQWDMRTGDMIQEYERHLAAVNTVTFFDRNRRFVSTSSDNSIRIWEYGMAVDTLCIADTKMHSTPSVSVAPTTGKYMLFQSLDNKILTFKCVNGFKRNKKHFYGHLTSGYACEIAMSPDEQIVASGDGNGKIHFWGWRDTKRIRFLQAHRSVTIGLKWHPFEKSKMFSCGWDGKILVWE